MGYRIGQRLYRLAVLSAFAACTVSVYGSERPNFLVFLIDDMGPMDTSVPFLSEAGETKAYPLNERYRTPTMQQLARQGLRFERFYANNVCSPSRISLLTGQSSARHRTTQWINPYGLNADNCAPRQWNWEGLGAGSVTLPGLLSAAGYHTLHVGKGHWGPHGQAVADPRKIGFHRNVAGAAYGRPGSYFGDRNYTNAEKKRQPPHLEEYHGQSIHLTEALTEEMLKQLTLAKATGKPIFAHMAFYAVHSPFEADPAFLKNYPEKLPGRDFAAMIEGMDHAVGRILQHLATLDMAEKTLVIFLGDNGSVHSSLPLRGIKAERFEGGVRVPFIVGWAKPADNTIQALWPIQPGSHHTENFGTILDLMPTILNLSGTKTPEGYLLDGHDLREVYAGQTKETFLMHFPHQHRNSYFTTWHHNHWKLIYQYHNEPRVQLFDLSNDPTESNDLSGKDRKKLESMFQEMKTALIEAEAVYPLDPGSKEPTPPRLN